MQMSNGSLASLSSTKEKDLPPIPPEPEQLMAPKSLNRKNVKKLTFSPAKTIPPEEEYLKELSRFTDLASQKRHDRHRPAPLLNLKAQTTTAQPDLVETLNGLDLSTPGISVAHAPLQSSTQRKRRTVISSISPTKSGNNTPSPRDFKLNQSPLPSTPLAYTSSSFNIRDEDLVHLKDLGSGNSGTVSKVVHVPLHKTMARKVVLVDSKLAVQTQIIRELRIMHECRSPYIIEFYGAFLRANNSIVLCMEYCNCGSLDKIIQLCKPRQFPTFVLKKMLFLILSGLNYLYKTHKIIHRDIKPSNVLMSHKGEFKLCDFGVSRELANSVAVADTFVGTSTYMSPERIQGLTYGIKSDIWSMGLMLYELASGFSVWCEDPGDCDLESGNNTKNAGPEGILDLLQRIVNEDSPTLSGKTNRVTRRNFDAELCSFIDWCLVKDDKLRKSAEELLEDKFLERVASGAFDKDTKAWAKNIRKLHKETYEKD